MYTEQKPSPIVRCSSLLVIAFSAVLGGPSQAQAQFPSKPVEIVVPFAPGGSSDLGARLIARGLEKRWNTPVRIINQPGGNTVPAVNGVMKAPPDGHKVLWETNSSSSVLAVTVPDLPFKVLDRTFISLVSDTPVLLGVSYDSPLTSLQDLAAATRKDPASISWTSTGGASSIDILFRSYFKAIGVDVGRTRMVVTKGGGSEAALQVAGGHIMLGGGSYSSFASLIQAKKLKVLAAFSAKRLRLLPGVPTTAEQGLAGLQVVQFAGLSGPPGIPPDVVSEWHTALRDLLGSPDIVAGLATLGLEPNLRDGGEMRRHVQAEMKTLPEVLGRSGS